MQLWASWPTPTTGNVEEFDEAVDLAARKLVADIETATRASGALDRFVYANYAAPWQDVFASYGAEVVGRLREVRRRYDPAGAFTKLVPGGFKF